MGPFGGSRKRVHNLLVSIGGASYSWKLTLADCIGVYAVFAAHELVFPKLEGFTARKVESFSRLGILGERHTYFFI